MGNVSERIKQAKLTRQQKKIADFFLKNIEKVGNMTALETAHAVGSSDVSIIRFARALGYRGFSELKNAVYEEVVGAANASIRNLQLSERFDASQTKYGQEDISEDFIRLMQYNLIKSFQQNTQEQYRCLSEWIIQARRKYIAGLRGCIGVSSHFSRLLGFAINNVILLPSNSETEVLGALQDIDEQDIFILFAFARYYKIDMKLAQMAKEHGARVCVITDSVLAPMAQISDLALISETSHMSFFNSAIGIDTIAEYIVTLVCRGNQKEYKKRAKERDEMTAEFRIV